MARFAVVLSLVTLFVAISLGQTIPVSDPQALSLAQKSMAALTGGAALVDVKLQGNVISILGADYETGSGTFQAKGTGESRVDLSLNKGTRSDVRKVTNGDPVGIWKRNSETSQAYAYHNCWTDAAWFLPALSALAQTANPNFIFSYLGQQQHGSINMEHLRVYQLGLGPFPQLGTIDFYLDAVSLLPAAVAFKVHPDNGLLTDIPVEVNFANYRPINSIQVPFRFQRMFNGSVVLDVTVTNAVLNIGLSDSIFNLP